MLRRLALTALIVALALPETPAGAQDDFTRSLINACVGCRFPRDMHGRDLHRLRFVAADLRGVDFSRADLSGAVFTGADLTDARFDDADLRHARFTGVRFRNTSFARAKMDGVSMEGVRLDARSVSGMDVRRFGRCVGCDFSGSEGDVEGQLRRALVAPVISPDIERALRTLAEHPPQLPRTLSIPVAVPVVPCPPAAPPAPPKTVP